MRKLFLSMLFCVLTVGAFAGVKEDIKDDMVAGRWAAADAKLVKVLKEHPNNAQAHYWMAQVKEHEGLPVLAREHLEKARELEPDLSFAGSPGAFAEVERRLTPPAAKNPPGVAFQSKPVIGNMPAKVEPTHDSGHGVFFWLLLLGVPLLLVWFLIGRAGKKRAADEERTRLQAELKALSAELRDAEKAVDGRAELNAEQKMALADRLSQAQGDLARELAALPTRSDFESTYLLISRLRDIAAEARGEEKPSLRAEREMSIPSGYAPQAAAAPSSTGAAVAAGVGGLLAGAALGSLLGGSREAHAADRASSAYEPIFNEPVESPAALDFGNDNGSESDWSDSSPDIGSDSGGNDDW